MINLLPYEGKKVARREYAQRRVTITLFLLCAVCFMTTIMLVPSLFLSQSRDAAIREEARILEISRSQRGDDTRAAQLKTTREVLTLLQERFEAPAPSFFIKGAVDALPRGVVLTHIEYASGDTHTLRLQGQATARENLIAFRDNLRSLTTAVELPVSALAKARDISFVLTLSFTQPQ